MSAYNIMCTVHGTQLSWLSGAYNYIVDIVAQCALCYMQCLQEIIFQTYMDIRSYCSGSVVEKVIILGPRINFDGSYALDFTLPFNL